MSNIIEIMPEEEKNPAPNWEKIMNLSTELDKVIDDGILKQNMSFLEIDISLYMVTEKILQEKHRILNEMYMDEINDPVSRPPKDFYR
jgi:hypothetical protein